MPDPKQVADMGRRLSVYLDLFIVRDGIAQSAINGSVIAAAPGRSLTATLDAVQIWDSTRGITDQQYGEQAILSNWAPVYTRAAEHGDPSAARRPIDYLIVTALHEEFAAISNALQPHVAEQATSPNTFSVSLEVKMRSPSLGLTGTVVVCQSDRMGNIASALTTAEALGRWAPRLVILLGITGGVAGRAAIGDAIVATQIVDYEAGKATWRGVRPHGVKLLASAAPLQRLMTTPGLASVVSAFAQNAGLPEGRRLLDAVYASGEKVVGHKRLARSVAKHDRKVTAIEMEALGVADACRRATSDFLVIKAVTDLADRRKSDDHRPQCCRFVSELAVHLIVRGRLLPPLPNVFPESHTPA